MLYRSIFLQVVLLALWPLASMAAADDGCGLDCLICKAVKDPEQYAEGAMKAVRFVVPGRDNWLFRSEYDLANTFGIPANMAPRFARLMDEFAARGTQVVIVLQPTRGLMHRDKVRPEWREGFDFDKAHQSYRQYRDQLASLGAIVPDLSPLIDQPPEGYFFRRDHHWTPEGARATARIVADHIRQLPVYKTLTHASFRTEPSVIIPKDGTMNAALRRICGNNFSFQYVQGYQTVPEGLSEGALFGDSPLPEIVLVGTSNSAIRDDDRKSFNFDGFLKEFLEADILNYALAGGGQDGALIQYLNSEDYDPNAAPKLIIWELPVSYQLEDPLMYRQLFPAIRGGCRARNSRVLSQATLTLPALRNDERVEILSNTGHARQRISGSDYFLELNFAKPHVKDFYLILYYDNGQRDKVWFRRQDIVEGYRYLLELSDDPKFRGSHLISVFFEASEDLSDSSDLEVRLCR